MTEPNKHDWHTNLCLSDHPQEYWEDVLNTDLQFLFHQLGLQASTKTDPKSLPYTDEVTKIIGYDSYHNIAWISKNEFYYQVVKELMVKDIKKLRFFCEISMIPAKNFLIREKTLYSFKYYTHA